MFPCFVISESTAARVIRRVASILVCLLMVTPIRSERSQREPSEQIRGLPRFVLWAWERPEDLRFINPRTTAVAFLADTIQLRGETVVFRPRLQSLLVPDRARLVAVVRIEADQNAVLNRSQIEQTATAITKTALLPRVVAVQVDFDATYSQRDFYRSLLVDLRRRLRPVAPISITALTSWCLGDDWISSLPINEAVPMLFRMGAGRNEVVGWLSSGRDFRAPICQESLGVSTDERWAFLPGGRRLYVFHDRPWTKKSELDFLREVQQWR
jgi:hypothetical protein